MKICKKSAFIGLLSGVFIFGLVFTLFLRQPSQKGFAYVNIDKVIVYVMSQVNKDNSQAMVSEEIESYKSLFTKTLDNYSADNNTIIFSSPKPISGAEDVTDLLIKKAFGKSVAAKDNSEGR